MAATMVSVLGEFTQIQGYHPDLMKDLRELNEKLSETLEGVEYDITH
jgi:F0F1-type ATP synthase beta subunit